MLQRQRFLNWWNSCSVFHAADRDLLHAIPVKALLLRTVLDGTEPFTWLYRTAIPALSGPAAWEASSQPGPAPDRGLAPCWLRQAVPVTSQVTTPPDHGGCNQTQPDTTIALTCRNTT
jgi:hypothetical protein